MQQQYRPVRDEIGYILGWVCGGILIVGVALAIGFLVTKQYRKAFQAFVLPWGTIAWLFIIMDGVRPRMPDTETGATVWVLLLLGGILFIPILLTFIVQSLAWLPRATSSSSAQA